MTRSVRRGPIPDELGWLADWMDEKDEQIRTLQSPDGGLRAGTVGHAASLRTYGAAGVVYNTGTVPNDATYHFAQSSPSLRILDVPIPTGEVVVTLSTGEASIVPGGGFVIASLGFYLYDANGNTIGGFRSAQRYTDRREGMPLSTGPQYIEIADPIANPGPYDVGVLYGMWVSALNTTPCSTNFSDNALVVQVVGAGVSL